MSKLERQIKANISNLSPLKREENLEKLTNLLKKGDSLDNQDFLEISRLLGYSDVELYKNFLYEQKALGDKLREKFPILVQQTNEQKNQLFKNAIQESTFIKKNYANLKEGGGDGITEDTGSGGCDRGLLGACIAGAWGTYTVVITSNCPGAAAFGPWGVAICHTGASVAYGAALYTCDRNFGC